MKQAAKLAVLIGGLIALAGVFLIVVGERWRWIGRLPGDIRIKKPGFSLFVPITTVILASTLLSVLLWILQKLFS